MKYPRKQVINVKFIKYFCNFHILIIIYLELEISALPQLDCEREYSSKIKLYTEVLVAKAIKNGILLIKERTAYSITDWLLDKDDHLSWDS